MIIKPLFAYFTQSPTVGTVATTKAILTQNASEQTLHLPFVHPFLPKKTTDSVKSIQRVVTANLLKTSFTPEVCTVQFDT